MAALDNVITEKSSSSGVHILNQTGMLTDHERIENLETEMIRFEARVDKKIYALINSLDKKMWFIIGMSSALGVERLLALAGVLH